MSPTNYESDKLRSACTSGKKHKWKSRNDPLPDDPTHGKTYQVVKTCQVCGLEANSGTFHPSVQF
jgi:hypothetical protein